MCLVSTTAEDIQNISSLLQTLFTLASSDAAALAQSSLNKSTAADCVARLHLLHDSMGAEKGAALITGYPQLLSRDLSGLPDRVTALQRQGCTPERAREAILGCPEIICLTEEAFAKQLDALRRLFPDDGIKRAFLAFKPRIFMIPADHLRTIAPVLLWDQEIAEKVWEKILHHQSPTPPPPAPQPSPPAPQPPEPAAPVPPTVAKLCMDRIQQLIQAIADKGASMDTACALTRKMTKAHIEKPLEALTVLLDAGWMPDQILRLCEANTRGLRNPSATLQTESALIRAGFSDIEAREAMCAKGLWHTAETQALENAVQAMLSLGVTSKDIQRALRKRPSLIRADLSGIQFGLRRLHMLKAEAVEEEPMTVSIAPMPLSFPPQALEYMPSEERPMDWAEKYRGLLATAHPRWSPNKITAFLKKETHLLELTPTEDVALEVLHRNMPLHGNLDKEYPVVMWYVAFISKPELKAVLELSPEALDIRIYVIKRILECDLLEKQRLLLLPFERVRHPDAQPYNPEASADQARLAFHRLMDELRYRKHEIEGRGKRPQRKPYVNMMAAETRQRFLHRLTTFVKGRDGGFKPPPFKREVLRRKSEFG